MVEAQDHDKRGQRTIALTDLQHVPPTVTGHTERDNGMTLHTASPDSDLDLEIYDGSTEMHYSGNPPEDS